MAGLKGSGNQVEGIWQLFGQSDVSLPGFGTNLHPRDDAYQQPEGRPFGSGDDAQHEGAGDGTESDLSGQTTRGGLGPGLACEPIEMGTHATEGGNNGVNLIGLEQVTRTRDIR
jgi:hypothetical protein